ncbi:NlpC/P60 family protein [Actinokineospora cianjurensis]|uniref:C40 family peptidase n=1 Tax=Actinokineospora cianjurensis TaxID=585224 RepID=UPI00147699F4|nr:C40 family peptidase [Actinokineospora cianjurensis]
MKLALIGAAAVISIPAIIGAIGNGLVTALFGGDDQPNQQAITDIPTDYLNLYLAAAPTCPDLSWSILAAIGKIETDHGRSQLPGVKDGENNKGAGGPMQFLAATFNSVTARHTLPPGGAIPPSRYNPHDAVFAAAHLLCDNGINRGDLDAAIYSYNHADWYVAQVLAQAQTYSSTIGRGANTSPAAAAQQAINYATGQLGLPYQWGGNGPDAGDAGFDCSGLTAAAYASTGITLPRTAATQYRAGPRVPDGEPLIPGDLVFYGTPARIHHVGLYIGHGQMIHAPDFGQTIKIASYRWRGDDYMGASRPAGQDILVAQR